MFYRYGDLRWCRRWRRKRWSSNDRDKHRRGKLRWEEWRNMFLPSLWHCWKQRRFPYSDVSRCSSPDLYSFHSMPVFHNTRFLPISYRSKLRNRLIRCNYQAKRFDGLLVPYRGWICKLSRFLFSSCLLVSCECQEFHLVCIMNPCPLQSSSSTGFNQFEAWVSRQGHCKKKKGLY